MLLGWVAALLFFFFCSSFKSMFLVSEGCLYIHNGLKIGFIFHLLSVSKGVTQTFEILLQKIDFDKR